jgi:hypothetical protein
LADQLLEFDVETTRQRLAPRLLASIADLPESVRVLDQASQQTLKDLCLGFVDTTQIASGEAHHED